MTKSELIERLCAEQTHLSAKEIAEEVEEMDTDDAADIIGELSEERQERVFKELDDDELAADIKELLSYEDETAGALMAKELVKMKSL